MRRKQGFTLVEILVSLGILSLLLGITYKSIVGFMQVRQQQDKITAIQAKLRRVMEVVSQDLRGSLLGAVINKPYLLSKREVSYVLMGSSETRAGELGVNTGFKVIELNTIYARFTGGETSRERGPVLLWRRRKVTLNASDHVIGSVLVTNSIIDNTKKTVRFSYTRCIYNKGADEGKEEVVRADDLAKLFAYDPGISLFEVTLRGIRFDGKQRTLLLNQNNTEIPLAFGISNFEIEYLPQKERPERVRIKLSAEKNYREKIIERQYVEVVELNYAHFDLREVVICEP